jgi:GDP-mannose 6-dehydrogenase
MRVSVFGLGYVGCVTASCLARTGHDVWGVDTNPEKVAMVQAARPPVVEPGLDEILAEVVGAGRLRSTASAETAVRNTELALICVGTPGRANGQIDVRAVERVAGGIGEAVRGRTAPFTVVLRSTVVPGTTERTLIPALREAAGPAAGLLRVAVNPEFMREGSSLRDFAHPPLTLVGADEPETGALLRSLYAGVEAPFVHTSVRTAEMAKYVANAFHALKICFANEIGDLSGALGVDARAVMEIFLMDRKLNVSEAYLRPGFAFGGSCLPKDLRALLHAAHVEEVALPVLSAILPSNEGQIRRGVEAILATRRRRVGVVGLAFKPDTDDLRESPLVTLVEALIGKGCDVRILDRSVSVARLVGANRRYIEEEIPHIASLMCESVDALLAHAEVLVVGTPSAEAARALAGAGPQHAVIDLTRGAIPPPSSAGAAA